MWEGLIVKSRWCSRILRTTWSLKRFTSLVDGVYVIRCATMSSKSRNILSKCRQFFIFFSAEDLSTEIQQMQFLNHSLLKDPFNGADLCKSRHIFNRAYLQWDIWQEKVEAAFVNGIYNYISTSDKWLFLHFLVKNCSQLFVANANFSTSVVTVGTYVNVSCPYGFQFSDNQYWVVTQCLTNTSWSSQPTNCTRRLQWLLCDENSLTFILVKVYQTSTKSARKHTAAYWWND